MYTMIPYRGHRDLDRAGRMLADSFLRPFFEMNDMMTTQNTFRVSIRENQADYTLEAEMPGVSADQIDLNLDGDTLTISCEIKPETRQEGDGKRYYYSERRFGRMSRSFSLDGIRAEDIEARYQDGILTVTLPKEKPEEKPQARKIRIQDASQPHSGTPVNA